MTRGRTPSRLPRRCNASWRAIRAHAANLSTNRDPSAGRIARAAAQYPFAAIVSCADSRVVPEFAFDQGPGELFVVRVAGNVVDDDGLATLEYGVKALGVPLIVVLGHSGCGAVAATIKVVKEGVTLPGHLPGLAASDQAGRGCRDGTAAGRSPGGIDPRQRRCSA